MKGSQSKKSAGFGASVRARPYLFGSIAVVLVSIMVFVALLTFGGKKSGVTPYVAKNCPVYPYCAASNQDESRPEFAPYDNQIRMDAREVRIFNKWMEANGRSRFGEPKREGERMELFSTDTNEGENRAFTLVELRQLLLSLDDPSNRGRLFMEYDEYFIEDPPPLGNIGKFIVRKNDKVLDYSGTTVTKRSQENFKLLLLDSTFNQSCPENPCADAVIE